jgi:hypothetical protein
MRAYAFRDMLANAEGDVTVAYNKRDGSEGSATGPVLFFNGREGMDTMSVTIDTTASKGRQTTVNLALVKVVRL